MAWSRTRLRTDYPVIRQGSLTWTPPIDSGHYDIEGTNFNRSDYMQDSVEKPHKGKSPYPNHPCRHIVQEARSLMTSISWHDWSNVVEVLARNFAPWDIDSFFDPFPPGEAVNGPATKCFESFSTQVPAEVSLPNFLYELKDIKGMIPKMTNKLVKSANDAFLGYQFGIKPFIGDVKKLSGAYFKVLDRIEFLRRSYGKPTRIHFFQGDFYEHPSLGVRTDPPPDDLHQDLHWVLTSYKADFRASATLYQKLEGLDDTLGFLRASAAALGFNNPAGVVWEAIPYSFVVDWLFKVNDKLKSMAISPFQGTWELRDVTCSVSSFSVIDGWIWPRRNFGNAWNNVYRVRRRAYQRSVGLPVLRSSLGTLSDMQRVLLGSLIYQRLAKH